MENKKKNTIIEGWIRDFLDKTSDALTNQLTKKATDIVDEFLPEMPEKYKQKIRDIVSPKDDNSSSLKTNNASSSETDKSISNDFVEHLMEDVFHEIIANVYCIGVSVGRTDIWESMIKAMLESGMEKEDIEGIFTLSEKYEKTPIELANEFHKKMFELTAKRKTLKQ